MKEACSWNTLGHKTRAVGGICRRKERGPFISQCGLYANQNTFTKFSIRTEKEEVEKSPDNVLVERCCKRALIAERADAGRAVGTADFPLTTIFWNIVSFTQ